MSDEVELTIPEAAENIVEVVEVDRQNEIVYLYCTRKPDRAAVGRDGKPHQMEIVKAGEHAFHMKAGQTAQMKRSVAEWHVAKTASFNPADFHLNLEVKTVDEMAGIKRVLEAQKTARENAMAKVVVNKRAELEKAAIAAGATAEDAAKMSDEDLATLLA